MNPILEIRGIAKSFGDVAVLHGIDLRIAPGEIIGLVGENGAGKSTLVNIIAGAFPPSAGEIAFDGRPAALASVREGQDLGIRFVHQELSTAGALSVAENIFLGGYRANRGGFVSFRRLNWPRVDGARARRPRPHRPARPRSAASGAASSSSSSSPRRSPSSRASSSSTSPPPR